MRSYSGKWAASATTPQKARSSGDPYRDIHRHFVNLGVVEPLDVTEGGDVLGGDKVDRDTLATETTTTTDPVDVVLARRRQVVVDDLRTQSKPWTS